MLPRLMFRLSCLVAALLCIALLCAQQRPRQRLSKQEQRSEFHGHAVTGTSVQARDDGYRQRLRLEGESPFAAAPWKSIGPESQSGRVIDIAAPLGDPQSVYVAFATGGLWRTTDDGISWTSLFDDQPSFGIGAIAVSKDGKTIWVGTGEANSQRTSYAGDGIYKSTDGGHTWTNVGLKATQHIGRIRIDPKNENIVWVAATGHLYSENPERGVYKTEDGGKTWKQVLKRDDWTGAIDIVLDQSNPNIVLASMWDRDRRAWDFQESGPGSGLFRTTDGGQHWTEVPQVPSGYEAGRIGLAECRSRPGTMYAFVDNEGADPDWADVDERTPSGRLTPKRFELLDEQAFLALDRKVLDPFLRQNLPSELTPDEAVKQVKDKKLTMAEIRAKMEQRNPNIFKGPESAALIFRSDDSGKTWRRTKVGDFGPFGGYYWGRTEVDPSNPDNVYVTSELLVRSSDGGTSWKATAQRAHVDFHAIWFDPRDTRKVWIGCDGGVYLSYDSGETVRHLNNLAVGQTTTLALDNAIPYNVYVGLQDNGTMEGPSTYTPGRSSLDQWKDIGGGDGSAVAVDPRDGNEVVYTAAQFGSHSARNTRTNERWSARANPPKGDPPARYNWISPITLSPKLPDIVYLGAQRVYRSFNEGRNYEPISPDITKNLPNGNVPFSTIKDISESPLRFGLIYAGCDDGNVQMTPDGGFQWISIPTPAPSKWVSRVVASRWAVGTVYVAQNGYRDDDFAPYLWKSTDFGKTWSSIASNLPAEPINVIREDPTNKDILYVGTDMGVFVSLDAGGSWIALKGTLPHNPVHDLQIQERDKELVAATHGRSAWILPLKTVYAYTPEIRAKDLTMLDVDSVKRNANWGYDRRERWDTTPPVSPTVTVSFFTREPGSATVRIKDKDGKVVIEKTVQAVRGFNDIVVDLQTSPGKPISGPPAKPTDPLKDPYEAERPQYIAAGSYTIELTVGGHTVTQAWKVTE